MTSFAEEVCHRRLAAQFLTTGGPARAADLVRTLGAVQAQDFDGAKWALGQRIPGSTDADIEAAFAAGEILRTHVLRPTWHFVAPADIHWLLTLTAPRVNAAIASYTRKLELDEAVFRRSNDALAKALQGGRRHTRAELKQVLQAAGVGAMTIQRAAHLMMQAELDLVVCSGPRRGKQFTYALFDERVPPAPPMDRDEALQRLALLYFSTRGPATVHDFAWWSGLTVGDARRATGMAGSDLDTRTFDGTAYFATRGPAGGPNVGSSRPSIDQATVIHLLPNYDEYFIGLKDRSAIGERLGSIDLVTGGDALIHHLVFSNGQLVGGWRRASDRTGVTVHLELLDELSANEDQELQHAVARLSTFLECPVRVER